MRGSRQLARPLWLWDLAVLVVLFLVALIPRVVAYGAMGNPDELGWLERSVALYDALDRQDWAATYQAFHPGVVPEWGIGALLCARYGLAQLSAWQIAGTLPMADLARTALLFPVLVSVLTVLAVYGLVRRLAGREAALYGALLLALEPFYLAFTHTIHLDLTQGSLMFVAALLWINYLQKPRRLAFLAVSGIVSGLALLTRLQAIYLVPFSLLAVGAYFLADNLSTPGFHLRSGWRRWIGHTVAAWLAWLGFLALAVLALWPALWVQPGLILRDLVGVIGRQVSTPHRWPIYFLGRVTTDDPGALYYALALLYRLRPLTLILVCLNPVLLAFVWRRISRRQRAAWALGLGYVVFYFVQMALGAHKLDRYLLPLVPALAVLAGVSLAAVVQWFADLLDRWKTRSVPPCSRMILITVVVILLAIPWLRLAPHFGAYFNPLVGGGPRAVELFTVGSGEGLEMAARYLNAKPDAQNLWALSFYPNIFRYYFSGRVQAPTWGSWAGLPVAAHYMVVTLGQVQREIYAPTLDFFLSRQPEYTVHINDLDYAWVYRVPRQEQNAPPPIQHPLDANFEHRVHLIGYDVKQRGDELRLTLYWSLIVSMPQEMRVTIQLVDSEGQAIVEQDDPPWAGDAMVLSWPDGLAVRAEHTLGLPAGLTPGAYALAVSLGEQNEEGQMRLLMLEGDKETRVVLGSIVLNSP